MQTNTNPTLYGKGKDSRLKRRFVFGEVCQAERLHRHTYEHEVEVGLGRALVSLHLTEDAGAYETAELGAGEKFTVPAGVWHTVKALAVPLRYHCSFVPRDYDGVQVEVYGVEDLDRVAVASVF